MINFNTYTRETLERRSTMATRLRHSPEAQAVALSTRRVTEIPFPKKLAPVPKPYAKAPDPSASLPKVDVIAMMDTAAEAQAMADVLTPGHSVETWYPYTKNFQDHYLPLIGPRGPSRYSKRLGSFFITEINGQQVMVFKTELHMHEDAKKLPDGSYTLPIKDLLTQIIKETKPKVFLTTGTSGGVYCDMHLGDVAVTRAARFTCFKDFMNAPFNHVTYTSNWKVPRTYAVQAQKLMQSYAEHLTGKIVPKSTPPDSECACSTATYPTQIHFDGAGNIPEFHPILTTDIFEFGTSTNNLDKLGMAVEMDDACLGLAVQQNKLKVNWACIRNLSDPTINGSLDSKMQENCAEYYYKHFGYWTTVMSGITTWGIIAGLAKGS
jgi:hypothetical protein